MTITIGAAWGLRERIKCKPIGTNIFFFQFRSREECLKVWYGDPWHIDDNLLVLEKFNGDLRPSEYEFNKAPFWIQVDDPPHKFMSESCAKIIGQYCGRFLDWDKGKDDIVWGRRLRVRVEINVNLPLLRGIKLRSTDGSSVWVDFKYEKLPSFCRWCGKLGHKLMDCIGRMESEDKEARYSEELHAMVPKGRRFSNSTSDDGGFQSPERKTQSAASRFPSVKSNSGVVNLGGLRQSLSDSTRKEMIVVTDSERDLISVMVIEGYKEDNGVFQNSNVKQGNTDVVSFKSPTNDMGFEMESGPVNSQNSLGRRKKF